METWLDILWHIHQAWRFFRFNRYKLGTDGDAIDRTEPFEASGASTAEETMTSGLAAMEQSTSMQHSTGC
jgi:hypothetical protein